MYDYYIDLSSTNSGIVLVKNDTAYVTSWPFVYKSSQKIDKYHRHIYKLKYISDYIHSFMDKYPPNEIYIEGPFIKKSFLASSEVLLKLHGIIIEIFREHEIHMAPPKTIKKTVTGNGNASKDDVFSKISEILHFTPNNFDESDALALMIYFHHISNIPLPKTVKLLNP